MGMRIGTMTYWLRKFRRAAENAARRIGVCGIAVCLIAAGTHAAKPPRSIAVMNCELFDDNAAYNDADVMRIQQARIGMSSDALRDQLRDRALYRVADNAPADKLITRLEAFWMTLQANYELSCGQREQPNRVASGRCRFNGG
jgi:hypothetical protein